MKLKSLKIIGLFTTMLFVSLKVSAQTYSKSELTSEWQIIAQEDGVEIYTKEVHCDLNKNGKPVIFSMLKVLNTTESKKSITYNYIHQYDQGCDGCDENPERIFTIELEANSNIEEDCAIKYAGLALSMYNPNLTSSWKFESVSVKILSIK
ncbi:MAG: hypothetical protein QNL61_07260 [Crocinitomicaceae bacterium]|jgi:hypothetical protein